MEQPYNPLEKRRLAESVMRAMLERPVMPLPPVPFLGAGIYALYYVGPFEAYSPIARANRAGRFDLPIYVGQALPEGGRRGGFGLDDRPTQTLHRRLSQHANSIEQSINLRIEDFRCRYLVADAIWIPLAESLMIATFMPLWNVLIDGFGIHDPGRGRSGQARSEWDELHPGRPFAVARPPHPRPVDEIVEKIGRFFSTPNFAEEVTQETLRSEDDGGVV